MIATALVFALGALVASLVALLFVPLLWRKAQRLARREFDATIPTSLGEVRAEIDAARAAAAFEARRQEMRLAETRETAARERAEAGRIVVENGDLLARQAEYEADLAERNQVIRSLEQRLEALTGERDTLHETRHELRRALETRVEDLHALGAKHHALGEAFDEQRFRLAAAETRIMELSGALKSLRERGGRGDVRAVAGDQREASTIAGLSDTAAIAPEAATPLLPPMSLERPTPPASEPISGSNRLRAAIAARAGGRRDASGKENAEIRERIGDIAARVIHKQMEAEGPQSPLARILSDAPPPNPDGPPTLIDRVRRLIGSDEASMPASAEAVPEEAEAEALPPAPASLAAKGNGAGRSRRKSRR